MNAAFLIEPDEAERLRLLLEAMADGLEELYASLLRQQRALTAWRLGEFLETVEEQKRLAAANFSREEERLRLVRELSHRAGSEQLLTLSEFAPLAGPEWEQRFRPLAVRIRQAGGKIEMLRRQNQLLISRSREIVNEQLKLLLELARLNRNTYEHSGRKARGPGLHQVLDRKA